jgi:Sigma-70, region 4
MVRRYEAGEPLGSIAARLGLSRERVRQIVKLSGAYMPGDYKCAVDDCDISPRSPRRYCYAHQVRFERYGDPLGTRPVVPLRRMQHGTYASYTHGGCRCDLCRKASANRHREYLHRVHPGWRFMPDKAWKT